MANSLLITKETGGYFSFVLNGNTARKVQSIGNDLLIDSTQCHFKTKNGANIVKEQSIYPADVTLVANGTFTFSNTSQLWNKLIEVGYFSEFEGLGKLSTGGYNGDAQILDDRITVLEDGGVSGGSTDAFLETGTIQKVGNTVSISANDFKWRINNVEYLTTSAFSQVVNTATDGYYRIDLIVANTSGGYNLIEGTESIDIVSKPDLPANTLEVTFIPVFGSVIGNITPSPDNSIAKQVSDTLIGNGQMDLVKGQIANGTDFFRIRFGQEAFDGGELEIATADIGSEPIYFRQYAFSLLPDGTYIPFSTVVNEAAILDANGDTRIPNDLYVNNQLFIPTDYYTKTEIDNKINEELGFACSDETSTLTTGLKVTFRMPFAMTLSSVRISLGTAPTIGSFIVDVRQNGTSIFSTLVSIDATELTSTTASVPFVLSTTALTDDSLMTIHVTQIGSGDSGKGLKLLLIGKKS